MRLTKGQTSANRELVLETAAKLFRERGFDGISLADLMREAGFTHGGFYNHFTSKAELCAEVARGELGKSAQKLDARCADRSRKRREIFASYVADYLSLEARDAPGASCLLPSLGAEIPRQGPEVRQAFGEGFETFIQSLMNIMPQQKDSKEKKQPATRKDALALLASLIGGMVMARSTSDTNPSLSAEILEAVREHILK